MSEWDFTHETLNRVPEGHTLVIRLRSRHRFETECMPCPHLMAYKRLRHEFRVNCKHETLTSITQRSRRQLLKLERRVAEMGEKMKHVTDEEELEMLEHELEEAIRRRRSILAGAEGLLRALYRCREEAVAD